MSDLRRTPYPQISQRSASFSIASQALKPAAKGRTALDRAGKDLESGRRLRTSGCLVSYRASCRDARELLVASFAPDQEMGRMERLTREQQEKVRRKQHA